MNKRRRAQPAIDTPRVGGRSLRVAIWRSEISRPSRPLLLFNGIGANIELLAPLAELLTDRDVITFDMPGVGESPPPVIPYRLWMMSRCAMRLLDHHGYGKVDVMGVSWGGCMAQQIAFQDPRRIGKVVLAGTSPGTLMVPGHLEAIVKFAHPRRFLDIDYFYENFAAIYAGELEGADRHVSQLVAPSLLGYLHQVVAIAGWTSLPFLPFLRQKTLVLAGDRDRIVPLANGRILAGLIPNARLHIVLGGGHLFFVSLVESIVPLITAFLDEEDCVSAKSPS